jgi:Fe-S-cluster containining protein
MGDCESNDLCGECGLCCSGYIYAAVMLEPDEIALAHTNGLSVEEQQSRPCMSLPCPRFSDNRCEVYAERPRACAVYECQTLWQLKNGAIERTEASSRIAEAVRWTAAVENAARGENILKVRIRRALEASEGRLLEPNTLRHRLNALDEVLDRWFRKPGEGHLPVFAELEGRAVSPPSESGPPVPSP